MSTNDSWEVVSETYDESIQTRTIDGPKSLLIERTERLRVPGGWLYYRTDEGRDAATMAFVPEAR